MEQETNQQQEQTFNDTTESNEASQEVANTIEHFKGLYETERKAREKAESQVVELSKLLRTQTTQTEEKQKKPSSKELIENYFN